MHLTSMHKGSDEGVNTVQKNIDADDDSDKSDNVPQENSM